MHKFVFSNFTFSSTIIIIQMIVIPKGLLYHYYYTNYMEDAFIIPEDIEIIEESAIESITNVFYSMNIHLQNH